MPDRSGWLEQLLRLCCAAYPRDFRSLLAADMAALYAREYDRLAATRGQSAALRYAASTLVGAVLGTVPARFQGVAPPRIQMEALLQDVRFAFRNLTKSPGFTSVALLSLALGIGANTAIFSVVNAVLLRGLPYPDADRMVVLWEHNPDLGVERAGLSGPTFLDWRERADSFEAMVLFQPGSATITDLPEPEQIPGMRVTVDFFRLLGQSPALGRDFLPEESRGGRANNVVVSHGFWQRAYGGDPEAIGEQFMGDHIPYTLVGVLAPDFWYPVRSDLFVPWDEDELRGIPRQAREFAVLARLKPDVTLAQAEEELDAIASQLAAEYPEMAGWGARARAAHEETTGFIRPALLVLFGAVTFVLLIACANVANLLLARASGRQREIAIRAATGASRGRLVRQLLTESAMLAAGGGLLGLLLGTQGVRALASILPSEMPIPGGDNAMVQLPAVTVDSHVLFFTALAALATGVLFGLLPAWQTSMVDLTQTLRQTERGNTSSGGPGSLRNVLVAAELALAVVLVVGAFLMVQTFWNLEGVDTGLQVDEVLTMQVELPTDSRYVTGEEQVLFYRQVLAELRAIPGVEAAGISEILPLDAASRRTSFRRATGPALAADEWLGTDYNIASAGYFDALGIRLVRGRFLDEQDDFDHEAVVLVDTTFAEGFFPGENPVGQQITVWDRPFTIVGIVGATRSAGLDEQPRPTIYRSYLQGSDNLMSFVLRTQGSPEGLAQSVKEAVWEVDPEQPVFNIRRMDAVVASNNSSRRLTMLLLGVFGALAVVMAALGVYGVMSYAVGQRTHELGLRHALGADSTRLLTMVVREGLVLALAGVTIGVLVGLAMTRALASLLYGVGAAEPLVFVVVAVLLLSVSVLATFVPARRAAAIDPMVALRAD